MMQMLDENGHQSKRIGTWFKFRQFISGSFPVHFRSTFRPLSGWYYGISLLIFLFLFFDHLVSFILLSTPRLFETQELSSFRIRKTILEHSLYSRPNKIKKVHQGQEIENVSK